MGNDTPLRKRRPLDWKRLALNGPWPAKRA